MSNETIDWAEIAHRYVGTTESESAILDKEDLALDEEDVLERFLDHNVERCPKCDWWVESSEVYMEEDFFGDIIGCINCIEKGTEYNYDGDNEEWE
jgi:hypothetical protein